MPVWDDLLNCVCQNGPQRPGVQEVIDTLQRANVCTGTQCFETEADAYGLTAAPSTTQAPDTMFFMLMMCAWTLVTLGARGARDSPPLSSSVAPASAGSAASAPAGPLRARRPRSRGVCLTRTSCACALPPPRVPPGS